MSGLKVWPVVLALLFASPPAKGEEPPFLLPHHPEYEKIPNGAGIEFFYGLWEDLSGSNHTPYLKIGPGKFTWEETGEAPKPWNLSDEPYRVLVEGPNYVLLLKLVVADIYSPPRTWTRFVVLTFTPLKGMRWLSIPNRRSYNFRYQDILKFDPSRPNDSIDLNYPRMTLRSCGHSKAHLGGAAMNWPHEKIMKLFVSSRCKSAISSQYRPSWVFGDGWSTYPYIYSRKNPPMNLDIQQLMDGYTKSHKV